MSLENYDSKEKVFHFLQEHAVAVISTLSPEHTPNAAPIYFVPDHDLNLYFITKSDTKKVHNIEKNNTVAITVYDPQSPIAVQAQGSVTESQNTEEFSKLAEENASQIAGFHWPPPLSKLQSEGFVVFYKFTPTWLRIADFSEAGGGSDKAGTTLFHQII